MKVYNETDKFLVRNLHANDFKDIQDMCLRVYPFAAPWTDRQLHSHLNVFPSGQLVAVEKKSGLIVGMASSLIVLWEDYEMDTSWKDFTDHGMFTNHDPNGKTLYGAEVMTHPDFRGKGLGKMLYAARREIVKEHGLLRIRAGARLRGYCTYSKQYTPIQYLKEVVSGKIFDPTVSFQIKEGFFVIALVPQYIPNDSESLGNAVVIEWLNPEVANEEHKRNQRVRIEKLFGFQQNI